MSHQAALDALGKMTRVMKAFEDVDVVLKALAGVEQNEREMRESLARSTAEAQAAKAELAEVRESLTLAKKAATKVKDDAQTKADQIIADAQEKASVVEQQIADARSEAAAELVATTQAIDNARSDHADAVAKLAEMEAKIDKARSQIAKLLG